MPDPWSSTAEKKEYDANGRHVGTWDTMGVKFRYHRDKMNRVDGVFYGGMLRERMTFDDRGRMTKKIVFIPQSDKLFYINLYSYELGPSGKPSRRITTLQPNELNEAELAKIAAESQQFSRNAQRN